MTTPTYLLLAVADPAASAALYTPLLGVAPVETSPTFYLYVLATGHKIGLWRKDGMEPTPLSPGGMEIGFPLPDRDAIDAAFSDWQALGFTTVQAPTELDFGYTFTLADPDGHRMRAFALSE